MIGAPGNVTPPVLGGDCRRRLRLEASDPGTWVRMPSRAFTYRWLRNELPIEGARARSYRVRPADAGQALACEVTARNNRGSDAREHHDRDRDLARRPRGRLPRPARRSVLRRLGSAPPARPPRSCARRPAADPYDRDLSETSSANSPRKAEPFRAGSGRTQHPRFPRHHRQTLPPPRRRRAQRLSRRSGFRSVPPTAPSRSTRERAARRSEQPQTARFCEGGRSG